MVDRTERGERERHYSDHVRWLQSQRLELQEHRMTSSLRSEEDFAVGSDVDAFQFESMLAPSTFEDATYRSIAMPDFAQQGVEIEVDVEPVVYRSLSFAPSAPAQPPESSRSSAADPDSTWLAAGRPPLLQRQRAFHREADLEQFGVGLEQFGNQ